MSDHMWQRVQILVEETQEKIVKQREIIAQQERKGLDTQLAKHILKECEETLARRIEIRDQMRERARAKAMRNS